jgi:hypothetical protein
MSRGYWDFSGDRPVFMSRDAAGQGRWFTDAHGQRHFIQSQTQGSLFGMPHETPKATPVPQQAQANPAAAEPLPKLQGSEKQAAWAEKIRADAINSREKEIQKFGRMSEEQRDSPLPHLRKEAEYFVERVARLKKAVAAMRKETSASKWINAHKGASAISSFESFFLPDEDRGY